MLFLSVVLTQALGSRRPPRVRDVQVTEAWLTFELADGRRIRMPTKWSRTLATATTPERRQWRLVAGGFGVAWPELGEIVSLHAVPASERLAALDGVTPRLPRVKA